MAIDQRGRLLFSEKNDGRIIRFSDGKKKALAKLNLTTGNEAGLLGLAVNGKGDVYAYYTGPKAGCPDPTTDTSSGNIEAHCVWRFRPASGKLKPDKLIFSAGHPSEADNHVGGGLHFGPDGALYLGLGDLGENGDPDAGPKRAQNLSVPFGKLLRLDPNATNKGASGNPKTCGNADNTAQRNILDGRIFACGLRNPYSFDWDRNGRLWVAEVGDSCDELNRVQAGVNYGWQPPRTDCSGSGAGAPVLKFPSTPTPSGVAVPKSRAAGSWRNDVFFGKLAEGSLNRYDQSTKKSRTVPAGSGRVGWDLLATDRYLYMSSGSKISRLKLPGA
jgi:glucose/arabinose dehydrogenase